MPHENASRSPRKANWRGMQSSWARIAARRGKALKLVLQARNRISAALICSSRNRKLPPKTALPTWPSTVGP